MIQQSNFMQQNQRLSSGFLSLFILCFLAVSSVFAQSPQPGDCLGAFTVCAISYNQQLAFSGEGAYLNEIDPASSCLTSGERNNAWYIVTVQTPGTFGFNIIPNCDNSDYDWAVFDLTNSTCADIATDPTLEVSCNFSGSTFPTSVTGMNNGANPQDEVLLNVAAGNVYAVLINNFAGDNQCGYQLDFSVSTAGIIDLTPPTLQAVTSQASCGATALTFSFSEFVKCNTVDADQFYIFDPMGNQIPISGVNSVACLNGGAYDKEFTLILGTPLLQGGVYEIQSFGRVEDNCGNFSPDTQSIFFSFNAVQIDAITQTQLVDCRLSNGKADVTTQFGTAPVAYQWAPSGQTSQTAQGLDFGWQYVTVTDALGCVDRDSIFIEDNNNFQILVVPIPDTCSFGLGSASVIISGGRPFVNRPNRPAYTIFWNVSDQRNDTTFVDSLQTGYYELSVTDSFGCQYQTTVFIPDYRFNLIPDFIFSPDTMPIPGIFPTVSFINESINATEFLWNFGSGEISTEYEPDYVFPGSGTYDVELIAMNSFGCKDSITKQVTIDFLFTFFAPTAFTPNDDLINDSFNVVVTGIMDSTYLMVIFDAWGQEVFITRNKKEAWAGKSADSGKMYPSGCYMFRNSFIDQSGKKHVLYGKVMLIG
jgi:gliding motility-associated-like protein